MTDPRFAKLADVLVNYSTGVKPGDLVRLSGPAVGRPLLVELYRAALKAGGYPFVWVTLDECQEIKLLEANDDQLTFANPIEAYAVEKIDVSISLWGEDNTKALTQVDAARQGLAGRGRKPMMTKFFERAAAGELKWCGTQFPCHAAAQDAEMSLARVRRLRLPRRPAALARSGGGVAADQRTTAATRRLPPRQERNPLRHAARNRSAVRRRRAHVDQLRRPRKLPRRRSVHRPDRRRRRRNHLLQLSRGARRPRSATAFASRSAAARSSTRRRRRAKTFSSPCSIKTPALACSARSRSARTTRSKRYTKNTLFDEKIGGTFHAAVGSSYPETGGKNDSALHWDMVCDLRHGGQIFVDGKLISENGRFLDPTWPAPEGTT